MRTILLLSAVTIGSVVSLSATSTLPNTQERSNGLPNLSERLLDSKGIAVFADFLIWTAREAGSDCWAEVIVSNSSTSSNDLHEVHFGWDPGLRVGISYGINHDQWDTRAYYTWFRTQGTDHISSGTGTVHSAFLGNFYVDNTSGSGLSGPAYEKAGIHWAILFNLLDWEIGRQYWVSQFLAIRPFLGVKGGWIHQSMHSKWEHPDLVGAQFYDLGREDLRNNFWGIGPQAGIKTRWMLFSGRSQCFHLFGDFSGALMYGHWSFGDVFNNDLEQKIVINSQDFNSGASTFLALIGFGWDIHFKEQSLNLKWGYEMQFWLDQLQFYSFTGGRLDNELTLQGGTFEICFDF